MLKRIKQLFCKSKKIEVYQPKNLEDCLRWLEINTDEKSKETLRAHKVSNFHFSAGMSMRNNWNLWDKTSEIHKWFLSIGIWHADDMSGIIIESFKRRLLNQSIDLEGQIALYKDFWAKSDERKGEVIIEVKKKGGICSCKHHK